MGFDYVENLQTNKQNLKKETTEELSKGGVGSVFHCAIKPLQATDK
jgi:hypothetical protein